MKSEIILEARSVEKVFPGKTGEEGLRILDNTSIAIEEKTTVAITGASGSGKSTLLHILGGLDQPNSGDVLFRGKNIGSLNSDQLAEFRNKNLGFVFQFHHLLPEFSALENTFMPGLISGRELPELKEKAGALLNQFGLGSRLEHRPSELSGGEQQRVAVARALINDPDVILADEPTGNLDDKSTQNLLDILFPLVENRGLTLVLVTHDRTIAASCDRMYALEKGKIEADR